MPYKYSPEQKAAAMVRLERNNGDLQRTAAQTGISTRSLHEWARSIQPWLLQHAPLSVQDTGVFPAFENDMDTLSYVRQQIMDEMVRISTALKQDTGISTPYQRVLVLSQLVDKLMKLDLHLRPYKPSEMVVRVVREDKYESEHDSLVEFRAAESELDNMNHVGLESKGLTS